MEQPRSTAGADGGGRRRRTWITYVGVILALLASAFSMAAAQGPDMRAHRAQGLKVLVFLEMDATAAQKQAIEAYLQSLDHIGQVRFESRAAAYQRFSEIYKDQPDLVAQTRPEFLPETYTVILADPDDYRRVRTELYQLDGVDSVERPALIIPRLLEIVELLQDRFKYDPTRVGEMTILLHADATEADKDAIAAYLSTLRLRSLVVFRTRADNYRILADAYRNNSDALYALNADGVNKQPESFWVDLADPTEVSAVSAHLEQMPGVDEVVTYVDLHPKFQ